MIRFQCPACSKPLVHLVPGEKLRCHHCGQRLQVPYPDQHAPAPGLDPDKTVLAPLLPKQRRSKEPDRGVTILVLGIVALITMPLIVGLVLGVITWVWANEDLRKMRAGTMDPTGRGMTEGGRVCAIIATVLSLSLFGFFLLYLALWGCFIGSLIPAAPLINS